MNINEDSSFINNSGMHDGGGHSAWASSTVNIIGVSSSKNNTAHNGGGLSIAKEYYEY